MAWVDLAALNGGDQLPGTLSRALGIASAPNTAEADAAFARRFAGGPWLQVLDSAEHLVEAVAVLASRLLGAAPLLAMLVTSQLPPRIAGARVHGLEPLALPEVP